jgi:DnaJ-class molecular chaperone
MIDPYKTLHVEKNASLNEIKKSYRKLAKQYHPDLNPGNKEAERKFKDISHAFDQIGTEDARAKFNRGETEEQQRHQYEQYQKAHHGRQQKSGHHYSSSFGEGHDGEDLFESLFGAGVKRSNGRGGSSSQGMNFAGEDELYQMDVDFIEAALGSEKVITLPNGKKLQIKIPAGIESGKKLKFKGLGRPGIGTGPSGDVYVQINIKSLSGFTRVENDIHTEVAISFFEAINGAEIEVPTIEGPVMLKVPAGVSSGSKLRVRHKGVGHGDSRGNQIVTLKIVMPKNVTPKMKEALELLQNQYAYNPRAQA